MSHRERRKHKRVIDKNIVLVTLLTVPGQRDLEGRTFTCTTADISIGGVRLISSMKIPLGTVMELRVAAVSPPAAFKFVGRVSWQLEVLAPPAFFIGIEFTSSDPQTAPAWAKFVEQKIPAPLNASDIQED
jgi:hypothetical protein